MLRMSSGTTFDPSREWLGIDAVDLADPRLVLGLSAAPLDRETVSRAADERLARLRGFDPGPFTIAHGALVKRVEQCRDELLASLPAQPRSGFAPPPPPGAVSRPPFVPAPAGVRPPPPAPQRVPAPPPAPTARPAAGAPVSAAPQRPTAPIAQPAGPSRRRTRWLPLLTLPILAAGLFAFRDRLLPQRDRLIAAARDGAEQFSEMIAPSQPAAPAETSPPVPRPVPPDQPPTRPKMVEEPPQNVPPTGPTEPAGDAPDTAPRPPLQAPRDPPPPADGATRPTETVPTRREQQPPPVDAARLDELLGAARTALVAGDFDRAESSLARARDAAGTGPAADRVAGWEQLVQHARRFAFFRGKALAAAAGRDFDVGDKRISVVEVTDRQFIFRHEGSNRRLPIDEVPEAIVMTLTKKWFAAGGQPANHLFIGARYLSRPEPDATAARKAWLAAQQGGEDVSLLLPLLDDPLLVAGQAGRR
jgi:hypothetical protein